MIVSFRTKPDQTKDDILLKKVVGILNRITDEISTPEKYDALINNLYQALDGENQIRH